MTDNEEIAVVLATPEGKQVLASVLGAEMGQTIIDAAYASGYRLRDLKEWLRKSNGKDRSA